ncbi:class I SAM-dependent methyltransferase [Nocardia sp. NPDC050406]|uniref:class I SAM-dependent methyltransferase n=1 Tax=Nocardia sp. NPDC050406 TaxID=3364318 RepID=UPI00378B187B
MDYWTPSHDRDLAPRDAAGWMFLREAIKNSRSTGAVAPSGRRLARLLADPVRAEGGPVDVLEVGAGTGSVTRTLLARLGSGSRLDIVEANPRFAQRLERLIGAHPAARRARLYEEFIEDYRPAHHYDVIVSGLPFTNFTPAQVHTIMGRYLTMLRPGGTLTYFTYLGTGAARGIVASRAEVERHRSVEGVLAAYQRRYGTGCRTVWGNLPPAHVWRLRGAAHPLVLTGANR